MPYLALLALLALAAFPAELVTVGPEAADAERLAREFDTGWRVPARPAGEPGLLPELEALLAARFEVTLDGDELASFGDVVRAVDALGRGERARWLERLVRAAPVLERHGEALRQLLFDEELRERDWNGDDDGERDGFWMGEPWELGGERGELPGPWAEVEVRPEIQQGAALVRADLATFKDAENDFRAYLGHRGGRYRWIYPEPGRYVRGEDQDGRPVDASLVVFRSDLPFPFTSYDCRLHVQNRLDSAGRLVCDTYSTSGDFHFLAGLDLFLPVRASDGTPVGLLLLRDFGLDLDGVPDDGGHVRAALRRAVGNIKLEAERRAALLSALGALDGEVPEFVMYGKRE
jgi:hypothetical protein